MPYAVGQAVPVTLLGTKVTAWVALNQDEHRRRAAIGLGPVADPALLEMLLNLPLGIPVSDPVAWVEASRLPEGIVERGQDSLAITRLLDSPLFINAVVVTASPGHDLQAVASASLFASYCHRWVATARPEVADVTMLEAKLCGVGLVNGTGQVLLGAGPPMEPIIDGWTWLMREKAYRRVLQQRRP